MEDEDNDRYRAPALDKGLDILELLAGIDGGLTQAEIAKQMGRNANEFYRMLDRLVKRGYVTKVDGDRYSLTLKLFGLGYSWGGYESLAVLPNLADRTIAKAPVSGPVLRLQIGLEDVDRGSAVVIAQQEAPGYWGISIRVGSHISLYNTGSGHVLLAFRSPDERAMMIREYEQQKGEDVNALTQEFLGRLEQIRERGYEMMPSLQTAGVVNISAPILGADGKGIAALTIPYITIINTPNAPDISQTIQLLVNTAGQLSKLAGMDKKPDA